MNNWFSGRGGATRKSPRLSPGPRQTLLNSGSLEKPIGRGIGEMKLEGNVQGLYNPLAWESMPSSLREKFPHWKDSSCSFSQSTTKEDSLDDERAIYNLKGSKQPPCTIPYVVMDRDSIQSIAVKFETTPSEIARINKKPTLTFSIFPGDVLYVPDLDELAKLAPPPSIVEPPVTSSTSSGDSESTPTVITVEGGDRGEGEAGGEGARRGGETEGDASPKAADPHISILSKYISEDQGCVHGSLVVNKSTLMFTPNNQDPLVKEHGVAKFEIIIPISDITYAAITHSVLPPRRRHSAALIKHSETATLTSVTEEQHDTQPLAERDGLDDGQDDGETERGGGEGEVSEPLVNGEMSGDELKESEDDDGRERMSKKEGNEDVPLIERTENDVETNEGVAPSATEPSPPSEDRAQVELATESKDEQSRDIPSSNSQPESRATEVKETDTEVLQDPSNMADDMLAIMGAANLHQILAQHSTHNSESSESVTSLDALLADSPYFLHMCVSPKSLHSYTYTPINSSVGIDIPRSKSMEVRDTLTVEHVKKSKSLSPPVVHHVRNKFCFAVIDKRLDDLVEFISHHHPTSSRLDSGPPSVNHCWIDEAYEFINTGPFPSTEDLSFQDDHFQSSSWEIYSLNDVPRSGIERMNVEAHLPLPNLSESSDLLLDDHIRKLMFHLPYKAVSRDWHLIYSTFRHGISLKTLYRNNMMFENEDSPILLIVRDEQKKLFGAAVTCRIRISEKFYGTGESFLYMFDENGDLQIFPWTGINNYVVKGNSDSFSIGSGDGHPGLWLDESFYHGASYKCSTFNNKCLASSEEFICSGVEAWGFL